MSSLRNAVKRITHKERSQPQSRKHLGMLEKHGDYVRRAREYHRKRERLAAMRLRADMRNPDEFYTGMHNSEVRDGKHRKTEDARRREMEDQIGADAVKMMKGQDLSYVRLQQQRENKRIERLQSSLHFIEGCNGDSEGGVVRKHTIFLEDNEKADNFDSAKHFGTLPEFAKRSFNRPRLETLLKAAKEKQGIIEDEESDGEKKSFPRTKQKPKSARELRREEAKENRRALKVAKMRATAYAELEARSKRKASLSLAESHLVIEKLVSGKGRKRKIKDAEDGMPAVYKWRRRRAG